ncbi:cytidylyltransferase domain-containing protein [Pedobacter fastidiosus]|uniref:Spore coat polysaccharide biosynthesis protein SpsF n=1 Tax=Pedobacter fastidiosus TaxID=2765361 RepID=A0ABR7KR45_9SPHI|nr:hypothetical protein [Pedobacter fastidiosus]MBC6110556.1 hypothetical protein [Pedobacter fastidiosus]
MIGIFVTARLGSTRLAQKHLIEANGKPFIKWLVGRYLKEFEAEIKKNEAKIFITTSVDPMNKEFENVFSGTEISIFYGSDANIPLRHLECAVTNDIDYIISIDGDDILCSASAAREVVKKLELGSDMVQTKGLPLGMNVMGYRTDFLKQSLENSAQAKLETGWGKIFDQNKIDTIAITGYENAGNLRMTLDYEDDSKFFNEVISAIGEKVLTISDQDLITEIIKNDWQKLNIGLNEEYWANFNKQKQEEN